MSRSTSPWPPPLELDEIEEVIEEVIEDAVLADLGNEPRIMFAHNA